MLQSQELDDSSSESSDLQLEGPNSLRFESLDESLTDLQSEVRPLVFFDLKLDNESGFSDDHPHSFLT